MKKLTVVLALTLVALAPLSAKVKIHKPSSRNNNDALIGQTVRRSVRVQQISPDTNLTMIVIRGQTTTVYRIEYITTRSLTAIPNGIIFNIDEERITFRTTENSVRVTSDNKLQYKMYFMVEKEVFDRIANAESVFEFTAMNDDRYSRPTTVNGKSLTQFTTQMQRILGDEKL